MITKEGFPLVLGPVEGTRWVAFGAIFEETILDGVVQAFNHSTDDYRILTYAHNRTFGHSGDTSMHKVIRETYGKVNMCGFWFYGCDLLKEKILKNPNEFLPEGEWE